MQMPELTETGAKPSRTAPLEIAPEEFRRIGHALVDRVADLLASIGARKVVEYAEPETIRGLIGGAAGLPEQGTEPSELMRGTAELLIANSLYNGHPRFWGYITAAPAPIGILGDMLAAAVNPNVGAFQLAPVATEIEAQTVRWIAEMLGYPTGCGGLLVSGGNMANFVCFLAARAAKAEHNIRETGTHHPDGKKLLVYASRETHTWIQKATDLFGFGTDAIRWLDTDEQQRLDVNALRRAVATDREAGETPMLVIGSAGTVSTGVIDPLPEIADFCREQNIWFHVDGAYGAFAALADGVDPNIKGVSQADSVAVDPHKWLYAPLEAGCALVRNRDLLRNAFSYHPPYYHFDEETINYFDFGPQNSRGFRALKVWLAIKQVGRAGYTRVIEDDIELTSQMHKAIGEHDELEALTCNLSIATFRYVPLDLRARIGSEPVDKYLDELNEQLLIRLKEGGEVFVSNAVIGGRFVLRACIVNFRTSLEDVRALPEILLREGRELHARLRREKPV